MLHDIHRGLSAITQAFTWVSVRCIHACTCQKLDRHTFIQSLFILHRLHLSWGHSDLLLSATMLIYIIKDPALETLLIQPWLPPVSPAIAERWNNTLCDFQAWLPTPGNPWSWERQVWTSAVRGSIPVMGTDLEKPPSAPEKTDCSALPPEDAQAPLPQNATLAVV